MLHPKSRSGLLIVSALLFALTPFVDGHAQSFDRTSDVVGNGGTDASSASYGLVATAGQAAAGVTSSSSFTIKSGFWYGGAGGGGAAADIAMWDGRDGAPYTPSTPTPGTNNNPVGRFKLSASGSGASLSSVTVSNYAPTPTGVSAIDLWTSTDNAFDAGSDTEVASIAYADDASFSSLGVSLPNGDLYVFIAVDLASNASGDYEPAIQSEANIGFSDGTLSAVNGTNTSTFSDAYLSEVSSALPVQLASFEGEETKEGVQLRWQTATETNNSRFEVERQAHGMERMGAWSTVGQRAGAGTTSEPQSYRFVDANLPFAADSVAYRLRQVDANGGTTLSPEIVIERVVERLQLKDVFPNPASSRVTVRFAIPREATDRGTAHLRLYDVLGRQVRNVQANVADGRHEMQMALQNLSSGTYFLRLTVGEVVRTRSLTVVK